MGNVLATVGIKALYYKKLTAAEIAAARSTGALPQSGFSAVDVYQDSATFKEGDGNSTYRNRIIDAVYNMDAETLEKGAKYEIK